MESFCNYDQADWRFVFHGQSIVHSTDKLQGSGYEEFLGLGGVVTSQDVNQIPWTLFRVGFLGNGPAAAVTATYTGSGKDSLKISRKSITAWVLKELGGDSTFIGKSPYICN